MDRDSGLIRTLTGPPLPNTIEHGCLIPSSHHQVDMRSNPTDPQIL